MDEEELTGGNSGAVARIGDTVRRPTGDWTPAVHALLGSLARCGINEVPQPLGYDQRGREVLTFLPGEVGNYPLAEWVWAPEVLTDAGSLLRRIHDATKQLAGADLQWRQPRREPVEVICHNDVAPYNMVFKNGRVTGLIDFDMASPGPRIWDFAYLAYRLVPFVEDAGDRAPGESEREARLDALIESYGENFTHQEVFAVAAARLEELAEYTDELAATTGRADLLEHAAMYRRDRDRLARRSEAGL